MADESDVPGRDGWNGGGDVDDDAVSVGGAGADAVSTGGSGADR